MIEQADIERLELSLGQHGLVFACMNELITRVLRLWLVRIRITLDLSLPSCAFVLDVFYLVGVFSLCRKAQILSTSKPRVRYAEETRVLFNKGSYWLSARLRLWWLVRETCSSISTTPLITSKYFKPTAYDLKICLTRRTAPPIKVTPKHGKPLWNVSGTSQSTSEWCKRTAQQLQICQYVAKHVRMMQRYCTAAPNMSEVHTPP